MKIEKITNFSQLKVSEAIERLKTSRQGLSEKEAKKRILKFGQNKLPEEKPALKIKILLSQFNNFLVYIILAAAGVSLFLRHFTDAIFILAVLSINIIVGFIQEYKAENTLRELKKLSARSATVLRSGLARQINAANIAIGDIVILKAGDIVPADVRIISAENLKIDEASLTGEFYPVSKDRERIEKEAPTAERTNMAFSGTLVTEGSGRAVVCAIGQNTEFGKIADLASRAQKSRTPLQKKIADLSLIIGAAILAMIFLIFVIGVFFKQPVYEIFSASIALAVSVIPEGLLPAITIILALGMRRMFKKKALVKRLSATETLGGVTVICLDKTGTLTEGKMEVSHILSKDKNKVLQIAALSGEAFIENPNGELSESILRGRPTDKALLKAAIESGISAQEIGQRFKEIDSLLFDSKKKYALRIFFDKESEEYALFAMGAPEVLIKKSVDFSLSGDYQNSPQKELESSINDFAKKGLRVIACGQKSLGKNLPREPLEELFSGISLAGVIALKDPLRKDAAYAMRIALRAGIRPMIVTGDYAATAKTIADEVGFPAEKSEIFEGSEIDQIDDVKLKEIVKRAKIFARVAPEHKLRIIQALKEIGEVAAMTGDGVNDAPALKVADIGIALGSGTEVSKEAADIVLLDDNFKIIIDAIEEGRTIFENIRKVLIYLIADDSSELLLFFAALFLKLPLPLLPVQILWIKFVEDGLPDVAITLEKREKEFMLDKPRDPKEPILNSNLKKWAGVVALMSFLAAFAAFVLFFRITGDIIKTRTIVFALMSLDSLVFAYSVRSFKKGLLRKDIFSNHFLNGSAIFGIIVLAAAIYLPVLQKFIQTVPLGFYNWLVIILLIFAEMLVIERMKITFLQKTL